MAKPFRRTPSRPMYATTRPRLALSAPLPACVVDTILRYHDQAEDQGGGRTLLRLSEGRLHDADVSAALGDLCDRAAGVSILWNEREDEIIRVLETPNVSARLAA